MTSRELFLPVAAQPSVESLVDMAKTGEELGYERAWLPETWGRDAVTVLTSIARETDDIGIGTSIAPVYSRSPALLGQTAATLQEVSDGRFRLGLGPSGPIVVENWHGVDYGNPLKRTRETVDIVTQVLSGETVEYDGENFDLSGFRLRCAAPDPAPAVDVAGMGPKAVELAGRFADGWHALMFTRDGVQQRHSDLERGAEMAEKDEVPRTTMSLTCAALEDRERARDIVRQHTAFYLGSMGTFYRDSLARQGHEETAHAVYEAWQDGNHGEAVAEISDDLLDSLAVAGTPEEAREQLNAWERIDAVDAVSVSFPREATLEEIEATTEALAP
ncbi:TIGR04024 family LLM class F420-dependent oxidoreductase [Halosegnis rubeus]|uniref:TIGR04024 family LLM class F420-dependent oxidoreductase n=1 Tax=Halosegnis rubeus TaxID=2212850 RepID=A0A5N5UBQ0_9EURY|nr:TIGR04024 family LLM class F420-dependent oxidoreductase [Halosegnis rubeus]KAB7515062.1 TIGR04024 family LLM class F420-dependent oxidoreductase [Halosegnis rubeus]